MLSCYPRYEILLYVKTSIYPTTSTTERCNWLNINDIRVQDSRFYPAPSYTFLHLKGISVAVHSVTRRYKCGDAILHLLTPKV